jgi:group I intron endonuclease
MLIYKITNKVNGRCYVGQTTGSLAKRWAEHQSYARRGKTTPLYDSMRKHGFSNFVCEILETVMFRKELNLRECYFTDLLHAFYPEGYVLKKGSGREAECSIETRSRISRVTKGRTVSNETRKKISETLKGRVMSEEVKKKISEANIGKHSSVETARKISIANKGKIHRDRGKSK